MRIEDILNQKIEEKKAKGLAIEDARKAEQLRQDQEKTKTKEAEKKEIEEARIAGIQASITGIDAKIEKLQLLLAELKDAHEQAKTLTIKAKDEGKNLTEATAKINKLFEDEEYCAVFKNEKINSLDDLLKAKEYSEDEKVKSVKELKNREIKKEAHQKIIVRGEKKREAREAIKKENPNLQPKPNYDNIANILEELIQGLSDERKKLYYQTPEGQVALKKEILEKISERHKKSFLYDRKFLSGEEIDSQTIISAEDIADAEKYSEEYGDQYNEEVKGAVKEYYGQVIDKEMADEAKKKGLTQLNEAVETIENLPARWHKIQKILDEVKTARENTINSLAELLGEDSNAPLFKNMNKYGGWYFDDPKKLATAFIDSKAKNNAITWEMKMGTVTPEIFIQEAIDAQRDMPYKIKNSNEREKNNLFKSGGMYNPDAIAVILAEQAEFYRKFQDTIENDPAAFDHVNSSQNNQLSQKIEIKSLSELGLGEGQKLKLYLNYDDNAKIELIKNSWDSIKGSLANKNKEQTEVVAKLKERINSKIEADWARRELDIFTDANGNSKKISDIEKNIKMQKASEKFLRDLDSALFQLEKEKNEQLTVIQSGQINFTSVSETDLLKLENEIQKINLEINKINSAISLIDQSARSEGDGLFGGKKKKRESDKAVLENEKSTLQKKLNNLTSQYNAKFGTDKKLNNIRACFNEAKKAGLTLKMPDDQVCLQELVDKIKAQMNFELTSEQQQFYIKHQSLKKKQEQTAKQYEEIKFIKK
jgi:hypothetical protein